jgi:hypothetical protein
MNVTSVHETTEQSTRWYSISSGQVATVANTAHNPLSTHCRHSTYIFNNVYGASSVGAVLFLLLAHGSPVTPKMLI